MELHITFPFFVGNLSKFSAIAPPNFLSPALLASKLWRACVRERERTRRTRFHGLKNGSHCRERMVIEMRLVKISFLSDTCSLIYAWRLVTTLGVSSRTHPAREVTLCIATSPGEWTNVNEASKKCPPPFISIRTLTRHEGDVAPPPPPQTFKSSRCLREPQGKKKTNFIFLVLD